MKLKKNINRNLSIIIPYYNFTYFNDCLKSLAEQTCKDFSVYIGDDNSPNNPVIIIDKYRHILNISYKRFEDNLGSRDLVKQWERCLQLNEDEEWIAILGDDDVMSANCVESFYNAITQLENKSIDVFRFSSQRIDQTGKVTSKVHEHPVYEKSKDFLLRRLHGKARSSLSEHIFRADKIRQIGFKSFPLAWNSDVLAIIEFSCFGEIYTCNQSIVYFRHSGANISNLKNNLVPKNQANFYFYEYLLRNYQSEFSIKESQLLFNRMEKAFLDDKKNITLWKKYLGIINYKFKYKRLFPFIKLYFFSVFKIK